VLSDAARAFAAIGVVSEAADRRMTHGWFAALPIALILSRWRSNSNDGVTERLKVIMPQPSWQRVTSLG